MEKNSAGLESSLKRSVMLLHFNGHEKDASAGTADAERTLTILKRICSIIPQADVCKKAGDEYIIN